MPTDRKAAMRKASTKFQVMVQGAIDEHLYFTAEEPTYISVETPATENMPVGRIVFVVFDAQNGHARGQTMKVPVERVISISTDSGA
jgi:hypothetical protein